MKGIRVLSLLDTDTNSKIGKKGAQADITIYSYKQGDIALELIEPTLYPEKIHPLAFGLALSDFIIFRPDLSKREFGETLGALIMAKKPGVFVGDADAIAPYVKGTALDKWETIEDDAIKMRERLLQVKNGWKDGKAKIIIDQVFNLKSTGVVVLGAIARGTIRVHDELTLYPANRKVQVKSLQLHDQTVEEISDDSRVGANIKGVEADSIERGSVLGDGMMSGKAFPAALSCPKFIKDGVKKDAKVFAYVGLQFSEAALGEDVHAGEDGKKVAITCASELAYESGDAILIIDPGRKPRIVAMGAIL